MITVICADCGKVWEHPVVLTMTAVCPKCGGTKIHVAVKK